MHDGACLSYLYMQMLQLDILGNKPVFFTTDLTFNFF